MAVFLVYKSNHFPLFLEGVKLFHCLRDSGHGLWMPGVLCHPVSAHTVPNAHSALPFPLQPQKLPLTLQGQVQISLLLDPTYVTPFTTCCNYMASSRAVNADSGVKLPGFKSDL